MKIPCKTHPKSFVERICASSTCKRDPALCWECMIDETDHARNHRDVMINIEEFSERLDLEFRNLQEKRLKDKSLAMEGHLKLLEEKDNYLNQFARTIENRKSWCSQVIYSAQTMFQSLSEKVLEELHRSYDEKHLHYQNAVKFITSSIQHRYGLAELPKKEDILQELQSLAERKHECNTYIISLKQKLLPPEDLSRNLAFQDTYQEFDALNDLVAQLETELENLPEGSEKNFWEHEPLYRELQKSMENQQQVLLDEIKQQVQFKDPVLSRHSPDQNLEESLNTIPEPHFSANKGTIAEKLYESPHLFETDKGFSPFNTQGVFNENSPTIKLTSHRADPHQTPQIKFIRSIDTQQGRGITSLLLVDGRTVATGSRDKTIRINVLDNPHQSFSLEGHIDQVTALCLFQEKLLISGGGNLDSSIIVWSLSSRKQISRLSGHQSGITSIIELSDHSCILSGSYDNLAIIWNVNTGKSLCALKKHTAMVSSLVLVKRDIIVTGSWDRTMALWQLQFKGEEIESASYLRELRADGAVLCIKKLNERCIISGGTANKVSVIDWISGEVKQRLNTSQFGICDILANEHQLIGLGASDSTLRIWKNGQEVEVYRDAQIQINNYNTNPKMINLNKRQVAVVNNNDMHAHFNIFEIA